jgi:polysaccharide biosynthesis protein PslG
MKHLLRRATVLVAAVATSAGLLAGCGPAPGPKAFGLHGDHTWDVDNGRIASRMDYEAAFGADVVRTTLRWKIAQPTATTFNWSKTDYVVNEAAERGMGVLFVVRDAPQWANGSADGKIIPSDTTGFNTFVTRYKNFFKAAVQRYGNRVKFWEIWTEANEWNYWQPRGLTPKGNTARWIDMYAQLYRDTVAAVRTVNTSVELAVGALSGLGATCCILGTTFVNELINRGVQFSDLAINPHNLRNQAPWTCLQYQQNFCDIQLIRNVLVNRGRSNVNLWVTEFGWQVGGYTWTGTTTTQLRLPGDQYKFTLWPNSGQVIVNGVTRNYSSINRTASFDTNGNGVAEKYNVLTLTQALPTTPANKTEVVSPQAESTHATYVREAIRMLRGTYQPASGRPQQNYNFVEIAIYFRSQDQKAEWWGMMGLMGEPQPNFNEPGTWVMRPRPAAGAFSNETD